METHVVTVGINFVDGANMMCEVFRGSRRECFEFAAHMGGTSHDQRPQNNSWVQVGTLTDWEDFAKRN